LGIAALLCLRTITSSLLSFAIFISGKLSAESGQVDAHVLTAVFCHLHRFCRKGFYFLVGVVRLWIPSYRRHHLV
ncbi:unnamed protein product, partial [Pylaiella littoralis]